MLPMFPRVLSNTNFDSYQLAPVISAPVLSFIAEEDTTVFPKRSESLLGQWAGDKHTVYVPGANHNSIMMNPIIGEETIKFLEGIIAMN
jgi:pimeloyl-ACP methyl ester carboxylesterase